MKNEIKKDKNKMSKKKKIILIIVGVFIGVPLLIVIFPVLFLLGSILWEMLFNVPPEPKNSHGEIPFEIVYKYKGEEYKIKDTIICDYQGHEFALDGGNFRRWECSFKENRNDGQYIIDKEIDEFYIEVPIDGDYLMGDPEADVEYSKPIIYYTNEDEDQYYAENDKIDIMDIEILKWECNRIKNNF